MIDNTRGYNGIRLNIAELSGAKEGPEAIKKAAREMEALFLNELIKVMRESTGQGSENSFGNSTYMSMFDAELSRVMSERGIGLQDVLLRALDNRKLDHADKKYGPDAGLRRQE